MIAPTGPFGTGARGSGRSASGSSPPAPIMAISPLVTGRPATSRSSTMSKPLRFGLLAQPGRPMTGRPSSARQAQQIARIDRHPQPFDLPAGRDHRRRDDIAAVDRRRRPGDEQDVVRRQRPQPFGQRRGVVRAGGQLRRTRPPRLSTRARVTRAVLASALSAVPLSVVARNAMSGVAKTGKRNRAAPPLPLSTARCPPRHNGWS